MLKTINIGDCHLIHGDCKKALAGLQKCQKSAIVTDPPYGINVAVDMAKKSGKQYGNAAAPKAHYDYGEWDKLAPDRALLEHLMYITEYHIIWGGNYFCMPPSSCWLVWDKENGSNNFADCELAYTNLKGAVRMKRHLWNGMLRKDKEMRHGHPTQKPLALMDWCITLLPDQVETIIDPFMGSGTTAIAAIKNKKRFIGVEQDEKYFQMAVDRVLEYSRQETLF